LSYNLRWVAQRIHAHLQYRIHEETCAIPVVALEASITVLEKEYYGPFCPWSISPK
jgi:hypothetical protein